MHDEPEYELSYFENAKGVCPIVENTIEKIDIIEHIFIYNENWGHTWTNHNYHSESINQITIEFCKECLFGSILKKIIQNNICDA